MPVGWLNVAAVPVPSAEPAAPLPASVVTVPVPPATAIWRMTLLARSTTWSVVPALLAAMAAGPLKRAAAPTPFVRALAPAVPASVVTAPVATTTWRIV